MDDSSASFRELDTRETDFQTVANGETSVPSLFGRPRARAIDACRGVHSRDEGNEHYVRRRELTKKTGHVFICFVQDICVYSTNPSKKKRATSVATCVQRAHFDGQNLT